MRDVILGVANSLDNYIASPDGGVDWLLESDDVTAAMSEFFPRIDTVIMGRKTFDIALKLGGGAYPNVKNYVFSRTLPQRDDVIIVSEDPAEFVRKLKSEPGKSICCLGGGEIAQVLFNADLIDEIGLNVHPVLLGSGVPLFLPLSRKVPLTLKECRAVAHDCVFLTYRVKR